MSFSSDAWARNAALYEKTRTMPFNQELASGQLDEHAFRHYMIQDAHYLVAFGRALAVAAAKADNADGVVQFADAAKNAVVVERSLHDGFMKQFGISADTFNATRSRPPATTTPATSSPPPGAPYPVAPPRCCPASGSTPRSAATSTPAPPSPTPTAPGSTPMPARNSTPLVREVIASVDRAANSRPPKRSRLCTRHTHTPRGWNGCSGIPRIGKAHGRSEPLKR